MPMSDNRLTERIQAAIRAAVRNAGVTHLVVACSGGGDSICLAHAAACVARHEGWQIVLGHVRHGMRADDSDDAGLVMQLARDLDLPCFVRAISRPALSSRSRSTQYPHLPSEPDQPVRVSEASLRAGRYRALSELARDAFADVDGSPPVAILTAHTQDDQAETVLMRLLRGSGINGLSAMKAISPGAFLSERPRDLLVRPLLGVGREETHAYCVAHDLAFVDDPTNTDITYTRNWLRHEIMPVLLAKFPDAVDAITRAATILDDDATVLRAATDAAFVRCTVRRHDAVTLLDRKALASEPVAVQRLVVRALIADGMASAPRYDRVEVVRRAICEGHASSRVREGRTMFWPAYGTVYVGHYEDVNTAVRRRALRCHPLACFAEPVFFEGALTFQSDAAAPNVSFRLTVAPWNPQEVAPPGSVPLRLPDDAVLALRNREPADRFHPHGAPGSRKLQDYLTDKRAPAPLRSELPLLVAGSDIVAVIGYDVSAAYRAPAAASTHLLTLTRTAPITQ